MTRRIPATVFAAFAVLASTTVDAAAPLTVADYVRQPKYEAMSLSPDGAFLAAKVPLEDGSGLAVLSRADLKVVNTVRGGRDTYVEDFEWATPKRLLMTFSRPLDDYEERGLLPQIFAVDVDGSSKKSSNAYIVDRLEEDDDHVLLIACKTVGCTEAEVVRADVYSFKRKGKPVDLPEESTDVVAEAGGEPRLAWTFDDDDVQKLYQRVGSGEAWKVVHDEAAKGIEKTPLRMAGDGTAYVFSEAASGPGMVQRFDLAAGRFTTLLRHPRVDPSDYIWSADGRTLIGAYFFDGRPEPLFVDPDAAEARDAAALVQAFPDAYARVLTYSRDGRQALVGVRSDRDPGRYYLLERDTQKLKFLLARSRGSTRSGWRSRAPSRSRPPTASSCPCC